MNIHVDPQEYIQHNCKGYVQTKNNIPANTKTIMAVGTVMRIANVLLSSLGYTIVVVNSGILVVEL